MTTEEIRKNAPDGATHYGYDYDDLIYLRRNKGVWNCWVFDGWFIYAPEDDEFIKPLN